MYIIHWLNKFNWLLQRFRFMILSIQDIKRNQGIWVNHEHFFYLIYLTIFIWKYTQFYIIANILRCKLPHVFVCMVHYDVHNSCYGLIAEGCFRQLGASLWMETEKISFFFLKYRKNRALSPYSYSFTVCHVLWICAQIFYMLFCI